MTGRPDTIALDLARWLRQYLESGDEESLHAAWSLGRLALERGMGVLDVSGALTFALLTVPVRPANAPASPADAARTEAFVLEALAPFEMSHRAASEAVLALRRVDEVREQDLRRIARELHDASGQIFSSVHLALSRLAPALEGEPAEQLERTRGLLVRAEEHLRRLAHEFRPALLDDLGLHPALAEMAESVSQRGSLDVRLAGELPWRLPPELETALYRAVQEAMTNVLRHSGAKHAVIRLSCEDGSLKCEVEDDGRGFDAGAVTKRPSGSLGLRGVRERVGAFGGTLDVRSAPGRGTRLTLTIPVEVPHAGPSPARR